MKPIETGGGPDVVGAGADVPSFPGADLIPGIGAFLRGVKLLDALPFGDSRIQQANRAAARAAGYTGDAATLNAIGGGLRNRAEFTAQTANRELAAQNAQLARGIQTAPATIPGQLGTFNPPDVYRPPPATPGPRPPPWNPAPKYPGTPPINPGGGMGPIVPVIDVVGVITQIGNVNSWITAGMNAIIFGEGKKPPTSRGGPNRRGRRRRPPKQVLPQPGFPVLPPEPRIPRAERVQARLDELGGDIYVNQRRLPTPAQPAARPVPAPAPKKVPLWVQLLPVLGPGLLSLVRPNATNTTLRLTDPLTQPQNPLLQPQGLTAGQTLVQTYLSGGFGSGTGGASGTCECPPKRKKGRKKKRTVCYSGTFTERADGLRKVKKRKVPCR